MTEMSDLCYLRKPRTCPRFWSAFVSLTLKEVQWKRLQMMIHMKQNCKIYFDLVCFPQFLHYVYSFCAQVSVSD